MKKSDMDRYLKGLRRDAQGDSRRAKKKPASAQQLAAMNIKVEGG